MQSPALSCVAVVICATGLFGCASGRSELDKRLSAMRQEISELEAQNHRLEERLEVVELKQLKVGTAPKVAANDPTLEHPQLKVIRLEPGESAASGAEPASGPVEVKSDELADDPTPRPVIRLRGTTGKRGDDSNRNERSREGRALVQNDDAASGRDGE